MKAGKATLKRPTLLSSSDCKVRLTALRNTSAPGRRPGHTHSTAEVRPKHGAISALREGVKRCDCDFEHLQGGPGGGSSPMQQHE